MAARIIGIVSGKGGTGKTVVTINLAASMCKSYKKKVAIVDCNITTPHIGLYLGMYSTPVTLNDVLRGTEPIEKSIYKDIGGIDVIPSGLKVTDLKDVQWDLVKGRIDYIADDYDFIILDSSPGLNRESLVTLTACHEALFVTNPVVHTVADLIKCKHVCENEKIKQLGIVLNMVHNKKYEMKKGEVVRMLDIGTIFSIPYDDKIQMSIVKKRPAIEYSQKLEKKFNSIAKFIIDGEFEEKENIFSRLFG